MTEKEIVNQLRTLAQNPAIDATDRIELDHIADKYDPISDKYDPPRPEPGTVVWFPIDEECGVVADNGRGVYTSCGELVPWASLQEGTKPARIAGPLQEIVDIPPVNEWPLTATAVQMFYVDKTRRFLCPVGAIGRVITRDEAARREVEAEHGE